MEFKFPSSQIHFYGFSFQMSQGQQCWKLLQYIIIAFSMLIHPEEGGQKIIPQSQHSHEQVSRKSLHSQYLPDFQISRVIARDPIVSVRCDDQRPFDHFFLRLNDLGYETNNLTNQTILLQQPSNHQSDLNKTDRSCLYPITANRHNEESHGIFRTQSIYTKEIGSRLENASALVAELNITRFQMHQYLIEAKQKIAAQLVSFQQQWKGISDSLYEIMDNKCKSYQNKIAHLEEELQMQCGRIEQFEIRNTSQNQHEAKLRQKIQQLEEQQAKLSHSCQQLEGQNDELKYQLSTLRHYEEKILNYEQEISHLNKQIDQNSEYVFDLQQKVANCNFQLQQKSAQIKKDFEQELIQEREKIQSEFSHQFERIQEQLRSKLAQEISQDYLLSIQALNNKVNGQNHELSDLTDSLQKIQKHNQEFLNEKQSLIKQIHNLQSQKDKLSSQLKILQQQRRQLIRESRDYQAKLHELQQIELAGKFKLKQQENNQIRELSQRIRELEQVGRERQTQLSYYKSIMPRKDDVSSKYRHRKNDNILVLEQSTSAYSKLRQSAISPSSANINIHSHKYGRSRDQIINDILSRIKTRQQSSIISQVNDNSFESTQFKTTIPSNIRPVSPQSILLEKEKDVRMRNISNKLQQLRSDIRKQIGMMKN